MIIIIFFQYFTNYVVPQYHFNVLEPNHTPLIGCCLCYRKRKFFHESKILWATIASNGILKLYSMENLSLSEKFQCQVSKVVLSRSKKTVKFLNSSNKKIKRIVPCDRTQLELWDGALTSDPPPFVDFMTSVERPIPKTILLQLYHLLIEDDMLIPYALCNFEVVKISAGIPLMNALFSIFTHANKLHRLYSLLIVIDFTSDIVTENTILRTNSHLTNLFKHIFATFGKSYFDGFLKQILERIDKIGHLNLSQLNSCSEQDLEIIRSLILTFLNEFTNSLQYISPEIRHLASILKFYSAIRFNSENATYNTLCGFFFLRFCSSIISNPNDYDKDTTFRSDLVKVFIPFAQLIQNPFNLQTYSGRFQPLESLNSAFETSVFPRLKSFLFEMSDIQSMPSYQVPKDDEMLDSVADILEFIVRGGPVFSERYNQFKSDSREYRAAGWDILSFLLKQFVPCYEKEH